MHVQCCGGLVSQALKFKMRMFRWQHIGVSLNLDARTLHVIYDDLEYDINLELPGPGFSNRTRLEVVGGGRLVVGQKLYSLAGDFIVLETLDGEVGDWRLYDTALEAGQMKALLTCREVPKLRKPLVDLHSGHFEAVGPTSTGNISLSELCSDRMTGFYLFFPQKTVFTKAYSWCRKLKGGLVLPEDPATNARFFDRFIGNKDECDDIWTHLFWIGSGGNLTTRVWQRLTDGKPLVWHDFLREYRTVTPEFQCIAMVTHDPYKWAACPCDVETCVLCNFTKHPEMRLRGLCRDSAFDRLFSFRDNREYRLVFDGLAHVVMEEASGTWVMRSRLYPYLKARMVSQWAGQYPVGVHAWLIEGDSCRQKQVDLLLTSCHNNEYTCNDGSCIEKSRRCDLSEDCEDQSDEMDCSVVVVPTGYSAQLPPPTYKATPLPILFALNITSVRQFDLVSFTIAVDVYITTQWKDRRLKYSNLLANSRANKLRELTEVWTPRLEVDDGTKSAVETRTHSQAAYVVRASQPLPDDDTTIREGAGKSHVDEKEKVFVDDFGNGPVWRPNQQEFTCAISSPKKESKFHGMKSFIAYTLLPSFSTTPVSRRYKHFDWIQARLSEKFPLIPIPPLPEKQISGRFEEDLIEYRMTMLQSWVDRICRHPVLSQCEVFHHFVTCPNDEKVWKSGKRKAESDKLVGANFYQAIERPDTALDLIQTEAKLDGYSRFFSNLDEAVKLLQNTCIDQTKKHQTAFKREYNKVSHSFSKLSRAFDTDPSNCAPALTEAIHHVSEAYSDIGTVFEEEPKHDWDPLCHLLFEYKGLIDGFPSVISATKGAIAKRRQVEKEASEGRLDDDQVPPMVIRSDTIAYALHAEVAHFHDERQRDFKKAMTSFLTEQINFYQKITDRLRESLEKFNDV